MRQTTPETLFENLSLTHCIHQALLPVASVLMDECGLSWLQIQQALPTVSEVLSHQLLANIEANGVYSTKPSLPLLESVLASPIIAEVNNLEWRHGVNFKSLDAMRLYLSPVTDTVFHKAPQYHQIIGVLIVHTQIGVEKLQTLLAWCTLFAIQILFGLKQYLSQPFSKPFSKPISNQSSMPSLYTNWLSWQPAMLAATQREDIMLVTGYTDTHSRRARLQQYHEILRRPTDEQLKVAELLYAFLATKPLAIAPMAAPKKTKVTQATTHTSPVSLPVQSTQPDIFSAPPQSSQQRLSDKLQKYWIATAMVASGLVFGGIGLVTHSSSKSPFAKTASAPQPTQAAPKYNDVAIMKVASQPASVSNSTMLASTSKSMNKDVKKPTEKLEDKNNDKNANSVKNDDKSSQKDKEQNANGQKADSQKATNQKTADKKRNEQKPTTKKSTDKQSGSKTGAQKKVDKKSTTNSESSTTKKTDDKKPSTKSSSKSDSTTAKATAKSTTKVSSKQSSKTSTSGSKEVNN